MKKFINAVNKIFWILCIGYYVFLAVAFVAGCIKKDKRMQATAEKDEVERFRKAFNDELEEMRAEEEMSRKELNDEFKADLEAMKKRREEYMDSRENVNIADELKKNGIFANDELNEKLRKAGWDYVSPHSGENEKG